MRPHALRIDFGAPCVLINRSSKPQSRDGNLSMTRSRSKNEQYSGPSNERRSSWSASNPRRCRTGGQNPSPHLHAASQAKNITDVQLACFPEPVPGVRSESIVGARGVRLLCTKTCHSAIAKKCLFLAQADIRMPCRTQLPLRLLWPLYPLATLYECQFSKAHIGVANCQNL